MCDEPTSIGLAMAKGEGLFGHTDGLRYLSWETNHGVFFGAMIHMLQSRFLISTFFNDPVPSHVSFEVKLSVSATFDTVSPGGWRE